MLTALDPGNVTFSLVNANGVWKHFKFVIQTTQVMKTKTNKTFKLLFLMQQLIKQLTISLSKVTLLQVNFWAYWKWNILQLHTNRSWGQQFTASNNRDIPGWQACSCYNRVYSKNIWYPWGGVCRSKLVELQGGANHYYVKRISKSWIQNGSTVTKFYVLIHLKLANNFCYIWYWYWSGARKTT